MTDEWEEEKGSEGAREGEGGWEGWEPYASSFSFTYPTNHSLT